MTVPAPFGAQSMVAPLRRVLVRAPDEAFGRADPRRWHYAGPVNLARAREEHAAFVAVLRGAGAEVIGHTEPLPDHADAIFPHDPALVTDRGAILLRMGKALRLGEEAALGRALEGAGVPLVGRLDGAAMAEGGDCLWLDRSTLAVGLGFRTNRQGVEQLRHLLGPGIEIVEVQLPWYEGPDACLHLMSLISLVADDLAVVYPPLLPVPFRQRLERMGMRFVEVPEREFPTLAANVLALSPGRCLMLEGNPVTQSRLEAAGCVVATYRGEEISLKAEGGPTCLTRPVWRGG